MFFAASSSVWNDFLYGEGIEKTLRCQWKSKNLKTDRHTLRVHRNTCPFGAGGLRPLRYACLRTEERKNESETGTNCHQGGNHHLDQ